MFRRVRLGIRLTLLLLLALALLTPEWPAFGDPPTASACSLPPNDASTTWPGRRSPADKAKGILDGSASDLFAEPPKRFVLDYLDQLDRALALEAQIEWVYADQPSPTRRRPQPGPGRGRRPCADLAARQPTPRRSSRTRWRRCCAMRG
jgi:hypothetical protein